MVIRGHSEVNFFVSDKGLIKRGELKVEPGCRAGSFQLTRVYMGKNEAGQLGVRSFTTRAGTIKREIRMQNDPTRCQLTLFAITGQKLTRDNLAC